MAGVSTYLWPLRIYGPCALKVRAILAQGAALGFETSYELRAVGPRHDLCVVDMLGHYGIFVAAFRPQDHESKQTQGFALGWDVAGLQPAEPQPAASQRCLMQYVDTP